MRLFPNLITITNMNKDDIAPDKHNELLSFLKEFSIYLLKDFRMFYIS